MVVYEAGVRGKLVSGFFPAYFSIFHERRHRIFDRCCGNIITNTQIFHGQILIIRLQIFVQFLNFFLFPPSLDATAVLYIIIIIAIIIIQIAREGGAVVLFAVTYLRTISRNLANNRYYNNMCAHVYNNNSNE